MIEPAPAVLRDSIPDPTVLPEGAVGVDAGLTLTKIARRAPDSIELVACETRMVLEAGASVEELAPGAGSAGVTGARGDLLAGNKSIARVQEIEAAACGAIALMASAAPPEFVLALMGTGTAFAAVRNGAVSHLGGTPMGGGSFGAIVRRIEPSMPHREVMDRAANGDRRNADLMVSDAYPGGIGRIGADLTAAHLSKAEGSLDDFLAGLLNMHGENIAQIAAGRALVAGIRNIVLVGGFVHDNPLLAASMIGMGRLFGLAVDVAPHAGFAGAVGAALTATKG